MIMDDSDSFDLLRQYLPKTRLTFYNHDSNAHNHSNSSNSTSTPSVKMKRQLLPEFQMCIQMCSEDNDEDDAFKFTAPDVSKKNANNKTKTRSKKNKSVKNSSSKFVMNSISTTKKTTRKESSFMIM